MKMIQVEIEHEADVNYMSNKITKGFMVGTPQSFSETKGLLSLPIYERKFRTRNKKAFVGYYNNIEDAKKGINLQKIKLYLISDIRCIGAIEI